MLDLVEQVDPKQGSSLVPVCHLQQTAPETHQ